MVTYKGCYIWFNDLQNKWLVQAGFRVVIETNTLQGAKSAITQKLNNGSI